MKETKTKTIRSVVLTGASFAGFNIGSGFATGVESAQFFASWGWGPALLSLAVATLLTGAVMTPVYIAGFGGGFNKSESEIYEQFFGRAAGRAADAYIHISMIFIVLAMMSGAGATVTQLTGLPQYAGASLMAAMCAAAALLGLERLRGVLGNMCALIVAFIAITAVVALAGGVPELPGLDEAEAFAERGELLRVSLFGVKGPVLSGVISAGVLVGSGFAWGAATGALCPNRAAAAASGASAAVSYYAATLVSVFLTLSALGTAAGAEVPMLAVVRHYIPALAPFYSLVIIAAIFSTITGRLFLISKRYGRGSRRLSLAITLGTAAFALAGGAFIPFGRITNIMFEINGAAGLALCAGILINAARGRISGCGGEKQRS